VTIDLQGHTITGAGTGVGITVPANSSLSNIELRNGIVRSFDSGIVLRRVKGLVWNGCACLVMLGAE
jgi:hypothetical protein